ncbi:hypothetical protein [Acidovorax sp. NB1]|uniref:hypothetical protein n=1 Tax=Acidovorax sp. NB1 TaxID=1943571 RepID=UPI0010F49C99|nr:hypothetical protein [Acidovorax sp. NB1]
MAETWALIWAASGVLPLLRWKFSEQEVTLLDVVLCVLAGSVCGPLIPLGQGLHSIKLKGGQHGVE